MLPSSLTLALCTPNTYIQVKPCYQQPCTQRGAHSYDISLQSALAYLAHLRSHHSTATRKQAHLDWSADVDSLGVHDSNLMTLCHTLCDVLCGICLVTHMCYTLYVRHRVQEVQQGGAAECTPVSGVLPCASCQGQQAGCFGASIERTCVTCSV